MKNIAFFTTTRADFGIFIPLLREIEKDTALSYSLFVGGTHLAQEHGYTIHEIQENGFNISATFDYLLNEDSPFSLVHSAGIATTELAHIFKNHSFDFVCVLGDRYELLSVVTAAILFNKPIIHIHGGEQTQGVIDEQIRHMITRAAHIHFVSCEPYRQNILLLGETKERIFNTGALSVDNIRQTAPAQRETLFNELGLDYEKKTILLTYHPVTLEWEIPIQEQIKNIFTALAPFDFQLVITAPNAEINRQVITSTITQEIQHSQSYHYFDSLGAKLYHQLIPHCQFVIGNSSSGLIEVPYFKIPTINIGDRQKGRIRHDSVIDCHYSIQDITRAIETAINPSFLKKITNMNYYFGNGQAAQHMVKIIKSIKINRDLLRKQLPNPQ